MSQGTPRKFSEKIAILERKQNEEQKMFHSVMQDIRAITSNKPPSAVTYPCSPISSSSGMAEAQCSQPASQPSPQQICGSPSTLSAHPLAYAWNRSGGSLPNVHKMVDQQPLNDYAAWNGRNESAAQGHQVRTRSPGAHYNPYCNVGYPTPVNQKGGERVPPLGNHIITPKIHLQPPDPSWFRARSDPTIHMNTMAAMSAVANMNYPYLPPDSFEAGTPSTNTSTSNYQMDYRNTNASNPSTPNYVQYPGQQSPQFQLYNNNLPMVQPQTQPQQIPQQQQMQQVPQQQQQQSPQCMSQIQQQYFQQQQYLQIQQRQQQLQKQQQEQLNNNYQPPMSNGLSSSPVETPVGSLTNVSAAMMQQCSLYNGGVNPITLSGQMSGVENISGLMSVPTTSYPMSPSSVVGFQPNFTFSQPQPQFYQQQQQLSAMSGMNASQSAPTSPAQDNMETPARQQWPPTRHFSASPDTLDIPNIVLTGADGTLDCFQDLQDLHLDNEIQQLLNDPCSNAQMDPAFETQLLN